MISTITTMIIGLSLVVLVVAFLRHKGIFQDSHAGFASNLLLLTVLPANIVYELTFVEPKTAHLRMVFTLLAVCLANLTLAYLCGRLLRLKRPEIGAFMMTAGFSASAFIGLPVMKILYPDNIAMHADAIVASELGMVVPILVLGPIIAQFFGEQEKKEKTTTLIAMSLKQYFKSPICWAMAVGLFAAFTDIRIGGFL